MGHGTDFGDELAVDHRLIRDAADRSDGDVAELLDLLNRHVHLMHDHVLPTVAANLAEGKDIAALDTLLLDSIAQEVRDLEASRAGAGGSIGRPKILVDLVEAQLGWETDALLPLLETETDWRVLEDLADKAQDSRDH